ncbi:hypothetical protein CERZMDRAFT_89378 [Cercospora zeae-maydis SCOH1-5]|uniref:IBR domain-containing protein n=1 Tax=Cercospora zeae-maydis SCOH1-5 TaxID=717836 RepID=A0A6A6F1G2_9PEZI|nr:hypothetical protein CERZMDRAFT_89378 [Cercospora zeae-maydis SCOH1-5]
MDNDQMQAEPRQCLVCLDHEYGLTDIPGGNICVPCLERAFRLAVNDPTSYPVKVGGSILDIEDYKHLLPAELVSEYKQSERMHKTPLLHRVFCAVRPRGEGCGKFLGDDRLYRSMYPNRGVIQITCSDCNALTCSCGKAVELPGVLHQCADRTERQLPASEQGQTWQRCPRQTCKAIATRIDGCNSMVCGHCHTQYCWLCGSQAFHDDPTHWWQKCPRFSGYDNPNAAWDAVPAYISDRDETIVMLHRLTSLFKANKLILETRLMPLVNAKQAEASDEALAASQDLATLTRWTREMSELSEETSRRMTYLEHGEADLKVFFGHFMKVMFTDEDSAWYLDIVNRETGLRLDLDEMRREQNAGPEEGEQEEEGVQQEREVIDLTED